MVRIKVLVAATTVFLTQTAITQSANAQELPEQWISSLYADHQLVGKLYNSASNRFVEFEELLTATETARYLLLGEKHDNPDHHVLQRTLIDHAIVTGRLNQVAFEMLDSDSDKLLQELSQQKIESAEDLKEYLQWDEEGWDWDSYRPLLQSVYRADIPLKAANISRDEMSRVYSEALPASIENVLDETLDAATMSQLYSDIDESHCGLLPESQFPAMVRVQQFRDYSMAKSLANSQMQDGLSVLVAGNYHIREDLGMPNYLRSQEGSEALRAQDILSVSFMEVTPESLNPEEYLQQFGDIKAYDYILFTPAISDEDYCASLQ